MYKVLILPLAEEDIMNNTDYIAFEKKAPETALELAMGFRNTIAKIELCLNSMNQMKMKNWQREKSESVIIKIIRFISLQMKEVVRYMC